MYVPVTPSIPDYMNSTSNSDPQQSDKSLNTFSGPGSLTHDSGGLTPEERASQPYPFNAFVPHLWPAYMGLPPSLHSDPILKTDSDDV